MFTNWLTGTTGLTNSTNSRLSDSNTTNLAAANIPPTSLSMLNSHNLSNFNTNIMTSTPDIILEVGPTPTSIRFMAHGLVLGMHSGYLRSAIRLDERNAAAAGGSSNRDGSNLATDIVVYLTNVTPEQFAPLLTYMYTGYLDLNVENIFGVLLATHVLHMPRALEICRSYLARAQTEGYFGHNNNTLNSSNGIQTSGLSVNSGKIIRPIASKPQLGNFGFLPLSHGHLPLNPIASNVTITTNTPISAQDATTKCSNSIEQSQQNETEEYDIEVDEVDKQSLNNENHIPTTTTIEDEDVEVFIDSNSETEVIVETEPQTLSFKKLVNNNKTILEKEAKLKREKSHHKKSHHNKSERRRKGSSGLQVAKAPIPASQLDASDANKVIIDVASCDGPVRFKRILNTAYGHKPEVCGSLNNRNCLTERSLQSVSLSFHQQMAKTISQQQQLHQAEESENSETSNGSIGVAAVHSSSDKANSNRKVQTEVFVCVYCKHSFKSQYCYQKHAKRHLNPLTLQATCIPETKVELKEETAVSNGELQITKHPNVNATRPYYSRSSTHYLSAPAPPSTGISSLLQTSSSTSFDYLKREVRPLDMNVQYYPCKTCGSKFPSYYFVHKHRKMCHTEEEAQQNTTSTAAADNLANSTSTVLGGVSPEECFNSQNSD